MAFSKITNTELNSRGATTLPNQPTISATALKQEFDAPAKNVVAPKFNNLIDELEATTASQSLGATAPVGRTGTTVQGVMNSISSDLATIETDIPGLVADEHNHANKALLDTYTQTEANLADAVTKTHEHANKSLLDTYTQADTDIADAVTKKHSHTNKTELDKIGESGGRPTYNGSDIGGNISNAYNKVKVGTTTLNASGNDTLELKAGSNVTLVPNASNNSVEIISTGGGGGGGGDMLKSVYANNVITPATVDRAVTLFDGTNSLSASIAELNYVDGVTGGIQTQLNGKAASSHTHSASDITSGLAKVATSGSYSDLSNTPTVDQTYDGTSANAQSGVAVASGISSAISGKADKTEIIHWIDATLPSGQTSYNITNALFKTTSRIVQILSDNGYPYNSIDIATNGTCTITFASALTSSLDVSIGISNAASA